MPAWRDEGDLAMLPLRILAPPEFAIYIHVLKLKRQFETGSQALPARRGGPGFASSGAPRPRNVL